MRKKIGKIRFGANYEDPEQTGQGKISGNIVTFVFF